MIFWLVNCWRNIEVVVENVCCNLSVEEEIYGEWMLDSMFDMLVIILNLMLVWFCF